MKNSFLYLGILFSSSLIIFQSCTSSEPKKTIITFWHFWSEPKQTAALQRIVDTYCNQHPEIDIELTAMQWSEGKTKIVSAFASQHPPDILHIGYEWVKEFQEANVLTQLPDSISSSNNSTLSSIKNYALPWVMNTRALYVHKSLRLDNRYKQKSTMEKIALFHNPSKSQYGIALPSYEPHNVLKKILPILRYMKSSIVSDANQFIASTSQLQDITALTFIQSLTQYSILETSNESDQRLKRGEIGVALSGMWLLSDSSILKNYDVYSVDFFNTSKNDFANSFHILSADCYTVPTNTQHTKETFEFIQYLSQYSVQRQFCDDVLDAGFPVANGSQSHNFRSPQEEQFWDITSQATVLPTYSSFLDAERIIEEEIVSLLYHRNTPSQCYSRLNQRLAKINL